MAEPVNPIAPLPVDGGRVSRALTRLAWTLWPACCLACHGPGDDGRELCRDCAATLPWNHSACATCAIPLPAVAASAASRTPPAQVCGACLRRAPPLAEARAACVYAAPLDRLLPRLKFHQDLAAGRLLAHLMTDAFAPTAAAWTGPVALLPLPLHRARLRQRGYDQALELARPLARALALPLLSGALRRARDTPPQSRLDAAQRRRNLKDAFAVRPGVALPPHVVLVDDVMTTGATLHAAAIALRRAGVARVDGWVCARVP